MTTPLTQTPQPPDPLASRRAFGAKLSAVDNAQHSSRENIESHRAEQAARASGYDAMADGMRDTREAEAIMRALHRGDDAEYLRLSEARDKRNLLKARGLTR